MIKNVQPPTAYRTSGKGVCVKRFNIFGHFWALFGHFQQVLKRHENSNAPDDYHDDTKSHITPVFCFQNPSYFQFEKHLTPTRDQSPFQSLFQSPFQSPFHSPNQSPNQSTYHSTTIFSPCYPPGHKLVLFHFPTPSICDRRLSKGLFKELQAPR